MDFILYCTTLCLLALSILTDTLWAANVNANGPNNALGPTLEGEFALQGGDYASAAERYLQAAELTHDPALAQRATEVALLTHQDAVAARALRRWRELSPHSADTASAGVVLALRRGDRRHARETLLAMLAAGGDRWKDAIRSLDAAADTSTATAVADDLLEQGRWPRHIKAWLAFADLAETLGDAHLVQRVSAEVIKRFPQESGAWLLESTRLHGQGDIAGARRAIEHALALAHGDASLRGAVAATLAREDPAGAAALLAHEPQNEQVYAARAAYLAQADDLSGLQALYVEVSAHARVNPAGAGEPLLLGKLAEYLKYDDAALTWYRSVPRDDGAGALYGEALSRSAAVLDRQGKTAEALVLLHAMQQDQNADAKAQRTSYQLEAQLLAGHKQYDAALSAYAHGLVVFDADPELLYGRALMLESIDRIAESEADLRGILQIDPDNAEALNALGYTLADRTRRYAEAQGLIEHALILQPDTPAFLDSLGWVQHRLGHDTDAARNLRRAFVLQKDAEIAAHLGEVLWVQGDRYGARAIWKQGRALDKDNRALQRVIDTYKP